MQLPVKPRKFITLNTDFGTSIAKALWFQAGQMIEYANQSYPLGMLMFFQADQPNMPASTPDPKYWKYMDGTVVVNTDSPFNGLAVPDLRNKFIRHPISGEVVLSSAGSDTLNLTHDHGGVTGITDDSFLPHADNDTRDRPSPFRHAHTISNPSTVVSIIPPTRTVQIYMRIV